ncbi:MAG: chemotaxis protein CheA [Deltaproteobacteria bacterium]|jgi:chemotaxis protein histidine kinase CheA|nr:chemotaxis protein CheA [Deltaproteobacteria bacterium]
MFFDEDKLKELLNQASLDLIMLSRDNVLELSSLFGLVENLGPAFEPLATDPDNPSPLPGRIIESLGTVLRLLILDQLPDPDRAVEIVGQGLGLLEELSRCLPVQAPFQGDSDGFLKRCSKLEQAALEKLMFDPDGPLGSSENGEAPSPSDWPGPEEPLHVTDNLSKGAGSEVLPPAAAAGQGAKSPLASEPFQPRKKGHGLAFIVPTPTQARRDVFLHTQKLTVDHFKADFTAALEDLQMKLVSVEQKADPVSAMAETSPRFRAILGGLSLLDLDDLARLTADTIGLIDYVVTEQVTHSTIITDILLKSCSFIISGLSTMVINPDGRSWSINPEWNEQDLSELRESLWAARQGILTAAPMAHSAQGSSASIVKPKKLGEILVEKGLISEGDLGGLIQAQKTVRSVRLGEILVKDNLITEDELNEALKRQQNEDKGRRIGEILVSMGLLEHEHIEKALKIQEGMKETKLGEIILKQKIGAPDKVAAALREQKRSEGLAGSTAVPGVPHTVKVETQKLDGLIDLVGELVITQSLITSNDSIKELKEQKINKDLAQVSRITSELQRNAMSLRMVQISNTFRKMSRLVRDLAHKFEKDVEFQTQGEDTEIDRNMVESLYDPLVHMIRNALDHGLELPKERLSRGKSPKGLVSLKAYHQGGNVVIELSDDGKGLDTQKVMEKAVEKGLIQPGENLSNVALHNLVFQPGFSTNDKITDISGRGVGMDVVRKSIELLRGKVDFTSKPNEGSLFTIRLPLTLAIIDGMIVRVGENRYILPTISINQSFRPKPEDYFTVKNQGEMIKVRDNLLPLVRLNRLVNVSDAVSDPAHALVVVVENEGQKCCLLVDEVLGKQEVVIKSLGERLKYVRTLAGGTILGDGKVGLILDVNGLFEAEEGPGMFSSGPISGSTDDWDMDGDSWN